MLVNFRCEMSRTIACLLTALFTFLIGVSIYSTHSLIVELLPREAQPLIQPLPVEHQRSPLRLGIFTGVDGVTFSCDSSMFNLFDDYRERETVITVSPEELSEIVHKLTAAGLLKEEEECIPSFISLPVNNTIIIAWPDGVREFTWIYADGCRVPEKYLSVLEEVTRRHHAPLIEEFITYNRR